MNNDERASLGWQVFTESNDAIFITAKESVVCEINPFAERLTAFPRSALVGRSLHDLLSCTGDRSIVEVVTALEQTGIFHSREQFCLVRRGAESLTVNLSLSRIHVGKETFGVVIARDISERVLAERKLRKAHDELEQRVSERTEELQTANDLLAKEIAKRKQTQAQLEVVNRELADSIRSLRAAEKSAIKQEQLRIARQLANGMAHDINNSITPIVNLTELIEAEESLSPTQRDYFNQIKQCAIDIGATVLRMREIKPSVTEMRCRKISLPKLLQNVADLTRPRWYDEALRRGVSIWMNVTVGVELDVYADDSALRSVLTNLVFNSIDAIHKGGQINVACDQVSDSALLVVSDNGEGMTPDQLKRCFEPFVSTRPKGCGLGLSLCKRIVEQHGGSMELSSESGKGTIVRVLIPIGAPQQPEVEVRNTLSETRFLFVEDNDVVRKSVKILLQSKGMNVDVAVDGPHALKLLTETEYDVVVSDLGLPGMSGHQLLEERRASWPHLKTVLVSGWIDGPHNPAARRSRHITMQKPFSVEELFDRLSIDE